MTQNELLDKILTLVPDAQCTIYDKNNPFIDDIGTRLEIDNYIVVWNINNTYPIPTLEELNNINDNS